MNNFTLRKSIISFLFLVAILFAFSHISIASAQTNIILRSSTPVVHPTITPNPFDARLNSLELKAESFDTLIQIQSNSFNSTISRLESNFNLILAIAAISSAVIALLGLGFARIWIRDLIEKQIQDTASDEIARIAQKELERIREEWEPKFASLYEEYRDSIKRE